MPGKSDSSLYLLGKYLALASLLPSGAVAGYVIGGFAAHWLPWSGWQPAGIALGLGGAMFKVVDELLRDAKRADRDGARGAEGPDADTPGRGGHDE